MWSSRTALRVALTITAITEESEYDTGALYHDMLPRLVELCEHVDRFRSMWETADAQTQAGLDALDDATISIEERPDLDLAVVTIPEVWAAAVARRFEVTADRALTNDALYPRTARLRVLRSMGSSHRLGYRYESWVQLRSRLAMPRVQLSPLADELTQLESGGTVWRADPIDRSNPELQVSESTLDAARARDVIERYLARAEPAWSPYD